MSKTLKLYATEGGTCLVEVALDDANRPIEPTALPGHAEWGELHTTAGLIGQGPVVMTTMSEHAANAALGAFATALARAFDGESQHGAGVPDRAG